MPNWERTPPVSGMSVEEIKRRVEAGIKRRRQTGELRPEGLRELRGPDGQPIATQPGDGPHLTKKQRRVLIRAAELAIYALANNDEQDYCHAADAINAVRRQAGIGTEFMQAILKGVAQEAAHLSGEPFQVLDQLARRWLVDHFNPSGKVISIPKGGNGG